jgi:Zn-dependent peptidase ImmA (M78 family)
MLSVSYPHDPMSLEPKGLRQSRVAAIAASVREQLALTPGRLDVELVQLVSRLRSLTVNGMPLEISWELSRIVRDERGLPAYGACEAIGGEHVLISINSQIVDDLAMARSTALHELGHVVFDAPAWFNGEADATESANRRVFSPHQPRSGPADWSEWRANEFMGNFLAPRPLLHRKLLELATDCGVPLVKGRFCNEPPVALDCNELRLLVDALGDAFGLTGSFIRVRMAKYDLIASPGSDAEAISYATSRTG